VRIHSRADIRINGIHKRADSSLNLAGGASERSIMEQTRHRSLKRSASYIRRGSLFQDYAAARCG
jgi:hypothetical protein